MPTGVYKRTKKHKKKISIALKGIKKEPLSKTTKKKISLKLKGRKFPKEHRKNLSRSAKARRMKPFTKEHRENISSSLKGKLAGAKNPNWKNGVMKKTGYVLIYQASHPRADSRHYVRRSHLVMEKFLGRFLKSDEVVHHINKIRDDDRFKNLKLFVNSSSHLKLHHKLTLIEHFKKLLLEQRSR